MRPGAGTESSREEEDSRRISNSVRSPSFCSLSGCSLLTYVENLSIMSRPLMTMLPWPLVRAAQDMLVTIPSRSSASRMS